MTETFSKQSRERAVAAAVDTGEYDAETSLSELTALAAAAGADVAAEVLQKREKPDPKTYFGAGKLEEIRSVMAAAEADLLIVDAELSASRLRNIERAADCAVIDRTMLILDIFARQAKTAEGKLQVELAQLRYRLPHLAGAGTALSRLGGGIGTRGPGESMLESDRRHIRLRIGALETRLSELSRRRNLARVRRKKGHVPIVSLAGYTNVGKSSLLNALTGSAVLAEDKLFATLDPTARRLSVGDLQQIVLVDTVGFVSRLPHHLVEAFHSTLEELAESDLILKVADASAPGWAHQLAVTDGIIEDMGCGGIPQLTVFNKCDLSPAREKLPGIPVSAKTGEGLETLLQKISGALSERVIRCRALLPFDKLPLMAAVRERGNVLEERYTEEGLLLTVTVDRAFYGLLRPYLADENEPFPVRES